ncbi:MAG: ATP-binding cassette domain-containing protein [Chitinophagaceae bacterium]|nr:ATP-binding cassette domain-containing protein [Chitinophagaceae bacterium]
MSIKVEQLSKSFDGQFAVKNLSFDASENGVIGFLGPNGAGKSTTMKMITGFLEPDNGKVNVCGIDALSNRNETRKMIGYLPEGNPLYYEMYVREYLAFAASVHKIANKKDRIEEVIKMTGLTPESSKKTGQLSKGYKQRVGLAAAIVHDPQVLILDEPTSGLDPNQIVEIRQLIKDLGQTKTVLFSSHILQEVESICSRVIIINKGELVADDSLSHLKNNMDTGAEVVVRFSRSPKENWWSGWNELTGVNEKDGSFYLNTKEPEKTKRQILEYALSNNIDILSIDSQHKSLEEIFKNLTNKTENQ